MQRFSTGFRSSGSDHFNVPAFMLIHDMAMSGRSSASSMSGVLTHPPYHQKRKQVRNACTNCQKACKKCADARPCPRCVKYGITDSCVSSVRKKRRSGIKRGPYKRRDREEARNADTDESLSQQEIQQSELTVLQQETDRERQESVEDDDGSQVSPTTMDSQSRSSSPSPAPCATDTDVSAFLSSAIAFNMGNANTMATTPATTMSTATPKDKAKAKAKSTTMTTTTSATITNEPQESNMATSQPAMPYGYPSYLGQYGNHYGAYAAYHAKDNGSYFSSAYTPTSYMSMASHTSGSSNLGGDASISSKTSTRPQPNTPMPSSSESSSRTEEEKLSRLTDLCTTALRRREPSESSMS